MNRAGIDSSRSVKPSARLLLRFAWAFSLVLLAPGLAAATDKCGAVCDETWTFADSPYVVTGSEFSYAPAVTISNSSIHSNLGSHDL